MTVWWRQAGRWLAVEHASCVLLAVGDAIRTAGSTQDACSTVIACIFRDEQRRAGYDQPSPTWGELIMPRAMLLFAAVCIVAADSKDEGFTPLFNGKDLTGWKTQAKKKGTEAEVLDGKTEAYKGRFKVKDGLLVIDPMVKGDVRIETAKSYAGDTVIRFEYRPGPKCNNDIFFRGLKFDLSAANIKGLEEGKWYKFEIAVKGDAIEVTQDGKSLRKAKTKGKGSPLEIRAEFGVIDFRDMRIKE